MSNEKESVNEFFGDAPSPKEVAERCIREPHYAYRINREAPEAVEHIYPYLEEYMETHPDLFCRFMLGFEPKEFQSEVLVIPYDQDIAARWVRQGGKSTTFGGKLLHYVWYHPQTTTLIVAPTLRQSLYFRDRMEPHINQIPERMRKRFFKTIQRTKLVLWHGATVYVLPNSLDKIRCFTAHIVLCDEFAMFKDPDSLLDGVIQPMFNTTNGRLWLLSTPKGKGHRFYEVCHSPLYYHHHVNWRRGVESGLTKIEAVWRYLQKKLPPEAKIEGELSIKSIDEILKEYGVPREFQMEFEAQFIEDLDTFLPYNLINSILDTSEDRERNYIAFEDLVEGKFYGGLDLGKEIDNSVYIVVEVLNNVRVQFPDGIQVLNNVKNVVHKKVFPLGTDYGSVIGYVKYLNDRWKTFYHIVVDQTGVGEFPVEDMQRPDMIGSKVEGVKLTQPSKVEIANYAKQEARQRRILIPYDPQLIDGLNVERMDFTKDAGIRLFHSEGDKDDIFWAWCLAIWSSREAKQDTSKPIFKTARKFVKIIGEDWRDFYVNLAQPKWRRRVYL